MKIYSDKTTLIGFGLALLMLILAFVVLYQNNVAFQAGMAHQQRSLRLINGVETIRSLAMDAETAGRGYALSGQDSFLEPYRAAVAGANRKMDDLRAIASERTE